MDPGVGLHQLLLVVGNFAGVPSPPCSRSIWPGRTALRAAVILKGELLIVSNRAEPSHTGLMYCTVHFSRNGMSHLFTALCKWLPFYLGATYAGQSAPLSIPPCNLRVLESAHPQCKPPSVPLPACEPYCFRDSK